MYDVNHETVERWRKEHPVGSRVTLQQLNDPYTTMEPGTTGTLQFIDDIGTYHIKWDNGRGIGLVRGEDSFTVSPPKPELKSIKLYMPLTATSYEYDEWGATDDNEEELDGCYLTPYEESIRDSIADYRMPEEAERGLMHWYGREDEIKRKVQSVIFDVELREDILWGIAECKISEGLSATEMITLKEYITGQASDGWGEGFEQQAIKTDDRELYVHLWNSERWNILTEEERFGPVLAPDLPHLCFSVLKSTGQLIVLKKGESGYYQSDLSVESREQNEQLADYHNEKLGVTAAQRQAMEVGSMFGWHVPGADPATYEQEEIQEQGMGGMQFA